MRSPPPRRRHPRAHGRHAADHHAVSARIDRPIAGWKVYTLYKPMNPPVYAPIYDVSRGPRIPATISPARLIEPEIMFRVDRDLPRRDTRYAVDELADAVTAVGRLRDHRLSRFQRGRVCRPGLALRLVVRSPWPRLHRRRRLGARLARRRLRDVHLRMCEARPRAGVGRRVPPVRQSLLPGGRGPQPVASSPRGASG